MKDPDDRKTHPPRAAASPDSGIAAGDMAPRPGPSARPDRRAQARSPESGRCADEVGHDIALDALAHAVVTEPSGQLDLDLAAKGVARILVRADRNRAAARRAIYTVVVVGYFENDLALLDSQSPSKPKSLRDIQEHPDLEGLPGRSGLSEMVRAERADRQLAEVSDLSVHERGHFSNGALAKLFRLRKKPRVMKGVAELASENGSTEEAVDAALEELAPRPKPAPGRGTLASDFTRLKNIQKAVGLGEREPADSSRWSPHDLEEVKSLIGGVRTWLSTVENEVERVVAAKMEAIRCVAD